MDDPGFYFAITIGGWLIIGGLHFGCRSFRSSLEGQYSGRRGAKSALQFFTCLMLVSLGFALIVMTTDRTQVGDYLAALILLEMLFGLLVFFVYLMGQFLLLTKAAVFRKNKPQKS